MKLTLELLDEISKTAIKNIIERSELKSFMASYYSIVATSHMTEIENLLKEKGLVE